MTKRERVMAAVRGNQVDRVPVSLWLHNFATENSAETLTAETLRLAHRFDWDFLKPQSRAQCFAEMWGFRYMPSRERATPYTVTRAPLTTAEDLLRLEPADPRTGALAEQLQALRAIRKAVGSETPIIWTVFSPLMVLPFLLAGGRSAAVSLLRSQPAAVDHALNAMTETLAAYARAAVAEGADGLFYATNMATQELSTAAECRRFQRPSRSADSRAGPECALQPAPRLRHRNSLRRVRRLSRDSLSWAIVPGNPSLTEAHRRTGRAVVGGLPAKPVIRTLEPAEITARGRQAIAEMHGRHLLLGPDCSIDPDTPEPVMDAATGATR